MRVEKVEGLKEFQEDYNELPNDARAARDSSLSSVGFLMTDKLQNFTNKGGRGAWPAKHPLTEKYSKATSGFGAAFQNMNNASSPFQKRAKTARSAESIGDLGRYIVRNGEVVIGFARDTKPKEFDKDLQFSAALIEKGQKIQVTDEMRRLMGSLSELGEEIGVDFFPLKSETKELVVPPRPIEAPVANIVKVSSFKTFENKFAKSLGRKNKLADREFRKGAGLEKND